MYLEQYHEGYGWRLVTQITPHCRMIEGTKYLLLVQRLGMYIKRVLQHLQLQYRYNRSAHHNCAKANSLRESKKIMELKYITLVCVTVWVSGCLLGYVCWEREGERVGTHKSFLPQGL